MDNGWLVRDFRPSDYAAIAEIWEETGMGDPRRGDTAEVIDRTLAGGGKLLVLQERDESGVGRLVGTSWITFDGRRLHLHHFAIRPSHQGRGLSKILLSATLRHARAQGIPIKLEVHRSNVRAIGLYRKAGFVPLGEYDVLILRDLASLTD